MLEPQWRRGRVKGQAERTWRSGGVGGGGGTDNSQEVVGAVMGGGKFGGVYGGAVAAGDGLRFVDPKRNGSFSIKNKPATMVVVCFGARSPLWSCEGFSAGFEVVVPISYNTMYTCVYRRIFYGSVVLCVFH